MTVSVVALVHPDEMVAEPGLDERPDRVQVLFPDGLGEITRHLPLLEPAEVPSLRA